MHPLTERSFVSATPHRAAPGSEKHLRWLVRRIADDDRDAFVEPFDRLAGPVWTSLHRQGSHPVQMAGVIAGTFVEVWWLAGCHVDENTDVLAWITDIVGKRVVDSRSFVPLPDLAAANPAAATASWTTHVEAELAALLDRRWTP